MTPEVARMRFRAATIAGHARGCVIGYALGQCCCGGRAAHYDAKENHARAVLFASDPDARAWIDQETARGIERVRKLSSEAQ